MYDSPCPIPLFSQNNGQSRAKQIKLSSTPTSRASSSRAKEMLDVLHLVAPSVAIFSMVPGFEHEHKGQESNVGVELSLPALLSSLHDPKYLKYSQEQLEALVSEKWTGDFLFTRESRQTSTRSQSSCSLWYDYHHLINI